MVDLTIRCVCGENFVYTIDLNPFQQELSSSGLLPVMIPHKDHFVTVYIDREYKIRSVERVILVDREQRSTVVSTEALSENKIKSILDEIKKEYNPNKNYFKFASALLYRIQEPEALFYAGKIIGYEMWLDLRKAIIQLGATYQPIIEAIMKGELKPILDKTGDTTLLENNRLEINDCIAPQFVVGLAQGILVAIGELAEEKMDITIEYELGEDMVNLSLKNA